MLRSALVLLSGNAAASLLLFARNLIIARLISVEDYGIAATFAIAMTVVDMASQLGLQQQIVQAREGDDPRFQAALQGFQALRGLIGALALFLLAGAMADFMNVPEVTWAYQLLAVVPAVNGLQHFDIHRLNRHRRFGPLALTGSVPALVALLAVWPLAGWIGDYRLMLYTIVLYSAVTTITSHMVADRPYHIRFDPAVMGSSLRFGWPLLINGLLLFAVFQGDKMLVGRELGMADLAIFAMGTTLTLTPTQILSRTIQSAFLPRLSRRAEARDSAPERFETLAHAMLQAALLNGCLVILGVLIFGPPLVTLLLGARYVELIPLLGLFALLHGVRVFKSGPAVIALSCGRAANAMIANTVRVASLPLAWWVLREGGDMRSVLWIGIAAESAGFVLSLWLTRAWVGASMRRSLPALAVTVALLVAAAAGGSVAPWLVAVVWLVLVLACGALRSYLGTRGSAKKAG